MLPLDLHVLGLSLAFILSQDQTLRCNYIFLFFSLTNPIRCSKLLYCLKLVWRWLYLLVSYYFVFFKYSMISFCCHRFYSESGYKGITLLLIHQIFLQLFSEKFYTYFKTAYFSRSYFYLFFMVKDLIFMFYIAITTLNKKNER